MCPFVFGVTRSQSTSRGVVDEILTLIHVEHVDVNLMHVYGIAIWSPGPGGDAGGGMVSVSTAL